MDFARLRDAQGYVLAGFKEDGLTPAGRSWQDWGGEAALVLLLEQMATGRYGRRAWAAGYGAGRCGSERRDRQSVLRGLLDAT